MAKLLYVTASPQDASASFSRKVGDAFVSAWKETHHDGVVDSFDVWTEKLPEVGPLAASWKVKSMSGETPTAAEDAERQLIQVTADRFLAADAYVFAVPMWNFQIPYRLKHFFDVIVQSRMTFGFDPAKGYFGLVPSERPVHLILSRAGSYAAGTPMAAMDFQKPYLEAVLGFIGLTKVTTQLVECTAYGPQVSDPIVAQCLAEAMKAGAAI